MAKFNLDIFPLSQCDIWFDGIPYADHPKKPLTLKQWAEKNKADIVYPLALYNMTGSGSDQFGPVYGRTLQYVRAQGKDVGYGGTEYVLGLNPHEVIRNINSGGGHANACAGWTALIVNGAVMPGLNNTSRRSRNANGRMKNGDYFQIQTENGVTIYELAVWAKEHGVVFLLEQDGGGTTAKYENGKTVFAPEGGRATCSVVCIRWKNKVEGDKPMGVKTYYKSSMSSNNLSQHFKVSEFACRDGTDMILIDAALVDVLEDIRASCGNKPISVNSGYRTAAYNAKIGGATNSYHMKGQAADITIAGVDTLSICKAAEKALAARSMQGGIGRYVGQNFVHVDTRTTRSRFQQDKAGQSTYSVDGWGISTPMPTIKNGSTGEAVKTAQKALGGLTVDGVFGDKTETAVRAFQKTKGLPIDGVVGHKTWSALNY